ncbi:22668_t:CDS:2, partial [Gigaspora margarita]
ENFYQLIVKANILLPNDFCFTNPEKKNYDIDDDTLYNQDLDPRLDKKDQKGSSSLRENLKAKRADILNQKEITNVKLPIFKKEMLQENLQIAII